MESEIWTKMLKKLSEKLTAKFPTSTQKFLTSSKTSRSITAAKRKEKEKKERQKIQKLKSLKVWATFWCKNFDFCTCPSRKVEKHDSSDKKGKLSCCKCIFHQIKANLAEIQPENHHNVQKRSFCKKLQESMGKRLPSL